MKRCLLALCFGCVLAGCNQQDPVAAPVPEVTVNATDPAPLVGKWLRPDGGYVLEIRAATDDGKLDAGYFNPGPINVSQATWRRSEELDLVIFVELRDQGYPGATYRLHYRKADDKLIGAYHQPTHGETFAVEFIRKTHEELK